MIRIAMLALALSFSFAQAQTLINGEEPATYYARLVYMPVEVPGSRISWYRSLSVHEPLLQIEGSLYAMGKLYLQPDGTFVYQYVEGRRARGDSYRYLRNQDVLGTWRVQGMELELSGLGVATGIVVRTHDLGGRLIDSKGITLVFNRDIITPGIKGKTAKFVPVIGTHPL